MIAILIGLGHSLLAMSGEESLAQGNREIASPKLKNLERAGFVIFVYSMLFTSLVSFFAVMIIPDAVRAKYLDNLISGLAMNMVGPLPARILFQAFVVVVGTIILSGAVNTAIVGSNGVLNRVAEDGVLPDWFRAPHRKFGTTSRLISLVVGLQILTIVLTRGNLQLLGDAYAFGVIWSFAMKSLAVIVLRYKRPDDREWKVPLNFHIRGVEIPIGLGLIALFLFVLAFINLFTKKVATIWGFGFTVAIFIVFEATDLYNRRRVSHERGDLEKFRLDTAQDLSPKTVNVRPGNVLVAVRNPHRLIHLKKILEKTDTNKLDIVVVSIRQVTQSGSGEHGLEQDQLFAVDETEIFSQVVALAEKAGKHVELVVVPGGDPYAAIVRTAGLIQSARIAMGLSPRLSPAEQGQAVGKQWESLPPPRPALSLEIVQDDGQSVFYNLGPHPPRLWPTDIDLTHQLWLQLTEQGGGAKLHHRDVVGIALKRLQADLKSDRAGEVSEDLRREIEFRKSLAVTRTLHDETVESDAND
jgi:Amino acid permease